MLLSRQGTLQELGDFEKLDLLPEEVCGSNFGRSINARYTPSDVASCDILERVLWAGEAKIFFTSKILRHEVWHRPNPVHSECPQSLRQCFHTMFSQFK